MDVQTIKDAITKLVANTRDITLEKPKDWETSKAVISKTHGCLNSLLETLQDTEDSKSSRFRHCQKTLPLTLDIIQSTSEVVNRLLIQVTGRFTGSESQIKALTEITTIPAIVDDIAGFLTPEKPTELSDSANIEGVEVEQIQRVRVDLFQRCVTFSSFMCDGLKPILHAITVSDCRSSEVFKPFLVCVMKQYLYIQRACACIREVLEFTTDDERRQQAHVIKEFFGKMKDILVEGKGIINSLSSGEEFPNDFKETIPPTITQIKQCYKNMHISGDGSNKELNKVLTDIEIVCDGISRAVEYGKKCLPPGEEYLGEDVAVVDSDFDADFKPSITKVSLSEYEKSTKSSDLLPTEVIGVYKLCDITRDVRVKVDIRRQPATSHIEGKIVKKDGKYVTIKEKDIKIQSMVIEFQIISGGEFLLLFYKFPFVERKFSKAQTKQGVNVEVNNGSPCRIMIPAEDIPGDAVVKYKEYKIENDRVEGYKKENPEEFGCFKVLNGLQIEANNNSTFVSVEFENRNKTTDSKYFRTQVKMVGGKRIWESEGVEGTEKNGLVSVQVAKETVTYITIVNGNIPPPIDDQPVDLPKLVKEKTLTFLGIQSQCKALILYRIPHYDEFDENEDDEIEVRVECIESQSFYLHNRAESQRKNGKWVQFIDGDESSDFLMKDESSINVEIEGVLKASNHYKGEKEFMFLKNSSCFIEIPLTITEKGKRKGWVYCYRRDKVLHWKSVTWGQIVKRYKDAMKSQKTISKDERAKEHKKNIDKQRAMENDAIGNMKDVVKEAFGKLNKQERGDMQKQNSFMGTNDLENLVDRFVARAKDEKNKFRFLINVIRGIGRNDIIQELTEKAECCGNPM